MSDSTTYKQTHHCGHCGTTIPAGTPCISDRINRRVEYFCNESHHQTFIITALRARDERG